MEIADIQVPEADAALDEATKKSMEENPDKGTDRKVEILHQYANEKREGKEKTLVLRFCVSPTELNSDGDPDQPGVGQVKLVHNEMYLNERGTIRPRATARHENLSVGLVFRSVGYNGVALPDVPFREDWGIIPNEKGRVIDFDSKEVVPGLYCAGWIKRGPSGVIGTNKPDAVETVECMMEDVDNAKTFAPGAPGVEAGRALVSERKPDYFSYEDWKKLDELECSRADGTEAPRVKYTTIAEMQAALGR